MNATVDVRLHRLRTYDCDCFLNILLSAYACEPGKGSEPDVGFQTMLTLAEEHEVWVLTRENNVGSLEAFLAQDHRRDRIHLVPLDLSVTARRVKRVGQIGLLWYYNRWQKMAGKKAVELAKKLDYDVAYHVTFAAYWMRAGVADADLPLILGPIGGGVEAPAKLFAELGWRGIAEEIGRAAGRRFMARLPSVRRGPRQATKVFVNNPQTAARLDSFTDAPIEVLPNPTAVKVPSDLAERTANRDIFFIARLVPWKGAAVAIRAMRYVETPGACLVINGDGPDRPRLERLVSRWSVGDRVRFEGQVPRDVLLRRLAEAGALVHPALHEEGGNAVAEALSMEVPVVCLDRGGPPVTISLFPSVPSRAVPIDWPDRTARAVASALDSMLSRDRLRSSKTLQPTLDYRTTISKAVRAVGGRSDRRRTP